MSTILPFLIFPSTAYAQEILGELRPVDVGVWVLVVTVSVFALLTYRRIREWTDTTSVPGGAIQVFFPNGAPPPLFGESWLVPGGLHVVLSDDTACIADIAAEILQTEGVVVGVVSNVTNLEKVADGLGARAVEATGRLAHARESATEPLLRTLANRGRPVVLIFDLVPHADTGALLSNFDAIGIVVAPSDLGVDDVIATRRVPTPIA